MSSPQMSSSFYPAKEEFDQFIASLPTNTDDLAFSQLMDFSLKAWELFEKGLPHSDRPVCLYYFFHFLPLAMEMEHNELSAQLQEAVSCSLADNTIVDYLKLLDKEKLFEVCQIRGELQTFAFQLHEFITNDDLLGEWETIRNMSENFLEYELTTPNIFLETYFDAYNTYCFKTKRPDARLYELAQQVLQISTNLDSIRHARLVVNDDENIRAYQKKVLPPEEVKKIVALEQLEQQVMAEFGETRIRNALGKTLNLLTKRGREQRAMQKQIQSEFCEQIRSVGRSRTPYVQGYAEFLCFWVYQGTDDIKKAIKSLEEAYNFDFDPFNVLGLLYITHDGLKHKEEAAQVAQKILTILRFESIEDAEQDELKTNCILSIKAAGHEPQFATHIYESILQQNSQKRNDVIAALEPKIQEMRKENRAKRINMGIEILDSLIPVAQTDKVFSNSKSLDETMIDTCSDELLILSLEEIDLFKNAGLEKLHSFYEPQISLQDAIEFIDDLMGQKLGDIATKIDRCIDSFPNLMGSVPIIKKYIALFVQKENQAPAKSLTDHAIEKRGTAKATAFYDAIRPLQKYLHENKQWQDEVALVSKTRKILLDTEFPEATNDLIDAYLLALDAEESLSKKDKLLQEAALENLDDDRLKSIQRKVDSLKTRRKKIIAWSTASVSSIALIFILIVNVLKIDIIHYPLQSGKEDSSLINESVPTPFRHSDKEPTSVAAEAKKTASAILNKNNKATGLEGSIPATATEQVQPANVLTGNVGSLLKEGVISASAANIRAEPSTAAGQIGVLRKGEIISILSLEGNWYKISMSGSNLGYVYKNLVSLRADNAATLSSKPSSPSPNVEKEIKTEKAARQSAQLGTQKEPINSTAAEAAILPIKIQSRPQGATVFVDKQKAGVTPLNIDLVPGSHGVKLVKVGYQTKWDLLRVKKDGQKEFLFQLGRK